MNQKRNGAVESEKYIQDKDDDSAFVRDYNKLPKPSSWSQPPTIINMDEQSTEDKKTIPCGKPSEEE